MVVVVVLLLLLGVVKYALLGSHRAYMRIQSRPLRSFFNQPSVLAGFVHLERESLTNSLVYLSMHREVYFTRA